MGEHPLTRRKLLAGAVLYGCSSPFRSEGGPTTDPDNPDASPLPPPTTDAGAACADPFAGATFLGTVPFTDETAQLDVAFGEGLNGRLYTDLSKLEPTNLVTPNDTHYIRTRYPSIPDPNAPWKIAVNGLVTAPFDLGLDMLAPKVKKDLGPFVIECSGNGSFAGFGMLSSARWSGAPIEDVLPMLGALPSAKRILVSGFDTYVSAEPTNSTPGASWIFTFEDLVAARAFLATEMNGAPLPRDHGYPVRLFVPNWYGCTCIKWVDTITLVDDEAAATSQMKEYASRTHQTGTPALARDYRPATIDQAAMPIRIEKWRVADRPLYRVVGIMWGGYQVTDKLMIRFTPTSDFTPVGVCPKQSTNATWTLWSHAWRPTEVGEYAITLKVDDPSIPTKRLDQGFYRRRTTITDV